MGDQRDKDPLADQIVDFYSTDFPEENRLGQDIGQMEWRRTISILKRHLPKPPAVVLDVGGATGRYALWLLDKGYETHLVDLVPGHVEKAKENLQKSDSCRKWSARVGDARQLAFPNQSADAILLMGPLYHFQGKKDRRQALTEARRVLRTGGTLICAAISRYASFVDGLDRSFILDPEFRRIVSGDLEDGHHFNPTRKPDYFTTGFFHHPDELKEEIREAGFEGVRVLAVEGILWAARNLKELKQDPEAWSAALDFMREVEQERSLLGASPHLLGIGKKTAFK